jgi:hypothetical protein
VTTRNHSDLNPFTSGQVAAFASSNPFETVEANDDAPMPTTYVLSKSGPDVDPREFERVDAQALEVMILWGTSVLHVDHLTPPRSYYVGEEEQKNLRNDFLVPQDKLGASRAPVVLTDETGAHLVILPGARGWIETPGQGRMLLENLVARNVAQPCTELSGAHRVPLPFGAKASMTVGDLTFRVGCVPAGRKAAASGGRDWTTSLYVGLSLAVHAGMMAAMALFTPDLGLADGSEMTQDQLYLMQQYLSATAETERAETDDADTVADEKPDDRAGGTGQRSSGSEGSMGNPVSQNTNGRFGIQGDRNNTDVHVAKAAAHDLAQNFGIIGVLNSGFAGDPNAPTALWGRDDSMGNDPLSARGNMWGDSIMDAYGSGGLGLTGIGEGGGGRGEGIGLGSIGTIGHGAGLGDGQGFGNGHGHLAGGRKAKAPRVSFVGATTVNGRIPPEVIQRIVRQNYGRFRLCYEGGLRNNPGLTGRVSVRFVIGRDGAVSQVGNAGSDLPSPDVVQCVSNSFYGLSFPQPEGGLVTVVYPIMFTPGG